MDQKSSGENTQSLRNNTASIARHQPILSNLVAYFVNYRYMSPCIATGLCATKFRKARFVVSESEHDKDTKVQIYVSLQGSTAFDHSSIQKRGAVNGCCCQLSSVMSKSFTRPDDREAVAFSQIICRSLLDHVSRLINHICCLLTIINRHRKLLSVG